MRLRDPSCDSRAILTTFFHAGRQRRRLFDTGSPIVPRMMKNLFRTVHAGIAAGMMLLAAFSVAAEPPVPSPPTVRDPDGPAEGCAKGSENAGFFARLKDSYKS